VISGEGVSIPLGQPVSFNTKEIWKGDRVELSNDQLTMLVLEDVEAERIRQNKKWGVQRHPLPVWMTILGEEFGESCQAVQSYINMVSAKESDSDDLYEELIHTAAVAVAAAEQVREERSKMKG
jgi:hypothetical protein